MIRKELLALFVLAYTFQGWAQDNQDDIAKQYIEKKISETADGSIEKLRGLGDMFWRGYPYYHVTKSNVDAITWYQKAAAKGDAYSMYQIGELYESGGEGVEQDIVKAAEWYRNAIDCSDAGDIYYKRGRANAMYNLGLLYINSKISGSKEQAWTLIEHAANSGNYWAMQKMALRYETGDGVPIDSRKSFAWYLKSAVAGSPYARKVMEQSAKNGNVDAMVAVGDAYSTVSTWKDYSLAEKWYKKAVSKGHTDAMVKLGNLYLRGAGIGSHKSVKQDYSKAFDLFKKASDAGNTDGMCMLGVIYIGGYGVTVDFLLAEHFFRKAMDCGYKDAFFLLGLIFQNGYHSVVPDFNKAINYYQEAGNHGSVDAMVTLANIYEKGKITAQDFLESVKWYEKAANHGDTTALHNLPIAQYKAGQYAYINKDFEQAFPLLKVASENSVNPISDAMILLAGYYNYQQNDYGKAQFWLKKAEEYKNPTALELKELRHDNDIYDLIKGEKTYE